jgi:hypothetical protein
VSRISPATRSRIIREIHANPHFTWQGTIKKRKVELSVRQLVPGVSLQTEGGVLIVEKMPGDRVTWRVCVSRRWKEGVADTVWEALDQVERVR